MEHDILSLFNIQEAQRRAKTRRKPEINQLILPERSEKFRQTLHVQLSTMPYLTRVLVSEKNKQFILERSKENELKLTFICHISPIQNTDLYREKPLSITFRRNYMNTSTDYQYRIFNIKAVIEVTALSRSTIYELIKPTSPYYDASFPKPIHLT